MEDEKVAESTELNPAEPSPEVRNASSEIPTDMPKFVKTLGKQFYDDERLKPFKEYSLPEMVGELLGREKPKKTPDKYVDDIFSGTGLTAEEAVKINDYYVGKLPKYGNLDEIFGSEKNDMVERAKSGISKYDPSRADRLMKDPFVMANPALIGLFAKLDSETGDDSFRVPETNQTRKSDDNAGILSLLQGLYDQKTGKKK